MERLLGGHRQQLGGCTGPGVFGLGDLCCLVQGDVACLEGVTDIAGVAESFACIDGGLGLANRGAGRPRHLDSDFNSASQHGLAGRRQLFGPGVSGQQFFGGVRT